MSERMSLWQQEDMAPGERPERLTFAVDDWASAYFLAPDTPRGDVGVLVHYDGGYGVLHRCKLIGHDGWRLVCAPRLQLGTGHTLVSTEPLTITPSILCPDCGLHGFVTDGRWVDAGSTPLEADDG